MDFSRGSFDYAWSSVWVDRFHCGNRQDTWQTHPSLAASFSVPSTTNPSSVTVSSNLSLKASSLSKLRSQRLWTTHSTQSALLSKVSNRVFISRSVYRLAASIPRTSLNFFPT
eukprot:GFUD01071371.1.p1 GENE.GFUD01071371.1~~GFUD01071371.1.p1  ORF type:complete len:113 (+),score=13.54 GFUD01071371.1:124-462(+)